VKTIGKNELQFYTTVAQQKLAQAYAGRVLRLKRKQWQNIGKKVKGSPR